MLVVLVASQGSASPREEIQPQTLVPLFPKPQPGGRSGRQLQALRNTKTGRPPRQGKGPGEGP